MQRRDGGRGGVVAGMSEAGQGPEPVTGAGVPSKVLTRARLVDSMAAVCTARGYRNAQVTDVAAGARVARSTFYEHFEDLERCLVEVVEAGAGRLFEAIDAEHGPDGVAHGLAAFLRADVETAWTLFVETSCGGTRVIAARARAIDGLAARLEREWADDEAHGPVPVSAVLIAGGIFRLVSMLLCVDECLEELSEELAAWIGYYRGPRGLDPPPAFPALSERPSGRALPSIDPRLPDPTVPGRGVRPKATTRQRILDATIATAATGRFEEVSVAEIVALAEVSRKDFYRQFTGKPQAAVAAAEQVFQAGMTACAAGFFDQPAQPWPRRLWRGGENLLLFFTDNPRASHFAFVTGCSVGREAMSLIYSRTLAFTIFLEEGARARGGGAAPGRLVHQALAATMFEQAFVELEASRSVSRLLESLPELTYVILAPFVGAEEAARFVADQVHGAHK